MRSISYSEVASALHCPAQHDFAYGDRLAGSSLVERELAPPLERGRAWGATIAAYHQALTYADLIPELVAEAALWKSLREMSEPQRKAGVYNDEQAQELEHRIWGIFEHYTSVSEPLYVVALEGRLDVALPALTGPRSSPYYRFHGYVDARTWESPSYLVEYKLRDRLTPVPILVRQRQVRDYAWAYQKQTGIEIAGVWVDETLNAIPGPARIVQAKRKDQGIDGLTVSHASDQLTTPERYIKACYMYGEKPVGDTLKALKARKWHQRVPIHFRPSELEEVGHELRSAARLIRDLDSGDLYPIRNATVMTCQGCRFREICDNPEDTEVVDALFDREPAKRYRDAA